MPMHDWTRVKAGTYHDFHCRWLADITNHLNRGLLPSDHYAQVEQVGDGMIADIGDLLIQHHVLFFPGQFLDNDRHVALGRHFGPLENHPQLKNPFLDHPEIFQLAASVLSTGHVTMRKFRAPLFVRM